LTDWVTRAGQAHLKQKAEAISSAAFTLADALDREVSGDEMLAAALRETINECQNGQGFIPAPQLLLIADILEKSTIDDSLSPAAQAVPVEHEEIDNCWYLKSNPVREQILAIAAELEDGND